MNRVTLVKVYWEHSDSSDSKARVIDGVIIPYQNEPLADWGKEESSMQVEKQILMDFIIYFKSTFEGKIL